MENSKLLTILKNLNDAQFEEVVFLLDEEKLLDKSHLSRPVAPTKSAIEVINLLKPHPDGIDKLEKTLKEKFTFNLDIDKIKKTTQIEESKKLKQEVEEILSSEDLKNINEEIIRSYHLALNEHRVIEWESELGKIVNHLHKSDIKSSFTPLERFVGFLIKELKKNQGNLSNNLVNRLEQWLNEIIIELNEFKEEIARGINSQNPCLLITICENKQKQNYYNIESWFIEDCQTYRNDCQIKAKPIFKSEESYPESKIQEIVRVSRNKCYECESISQLPIHIFLPIKLMKLDIDAWSIQEQPVGRSRRLFGLEHEIMLHSQDRLNNIYGNDLKNKLKEKWDNVETLYWETVSSIFEDVDPDDPDALYKKGQIDKIVAIKWSQPLSILQKNIEIDDLFEELILCSPIPLALWAREAVDGIDFAKELHNILEECCHLQKFPKEIKEKRLKAKRGDMVNHLSLFWDDPKLLPPQDKAMKKNNSLW
jgi:hypothetical protein